MAIVYVQEFDVPAGDRSTANYDEIARRVGGDSDPPAGLIVHTAGFAGDTFRIMDVWESEAAWNAFRDKRLMPVLKEVMGGDPEAGPPMREYTYELHDVITP
ncbi:MAG TPA: hypothetical protein VKD47_08205 [Miltoncostaeaceae bacterium]|nr:hypothetical protein [Miltoncostaeaceae bacterium]